MCGSKKANSSSSHGRLEHRPVADEEAHVLLFEPASTLNTGNVRGERTIDNPRWLLTEPGSYSASSNAMASRLRICDHSCYRYRSCIESFNRSCGVRVV